MCELRSSIATQDEMEEDDLLNEDMHKSGSLTVGGHYSPLGIMETFEKLIGYICFFMWVSLTF